MSRRLYLKLILLKNRTRLFWFSLFLRLSGGETKEFLLFENRIIAVLAAAVLMGLGLCACGHAVATPPASADGETVLSDGEVPGADVDASLPSDTSDESWPSDEAGEHFSGVLIGPEVPERERVDDAFFADAAFFGNSLMEGLGGFGGLENGTFFAQASTALYNLDTETDVQLDDGASGTLYQAMTQRQYEKIYVLLGINEIGWDPGYFAERYGEFLSRLQCDEPGADIYIISLLPVTRQVSESSEYFNMDRVYAYNEALLALAAKHGCWYLDLCRVLTGGDGYLPQEFASFDGIHFSQDTYRLWADFLRTHYAGQPQYGE